jgi:hypothetical protein
MREVQLRLPLGLGHVVQTTVSRRDAERVAFCLVSHVDVGGTVRLLVRDVVVLDDHEYERVGLATTWRGSAMLPIIERAIDEQLGVLLVHAHGVVPPKLSRTDIESARRIVPMLQRRVPSRPHGSIVLAGHEAAGLVALPGGTMKQVDIAVRWLGRAIVDWREPAKGAADDAFASQLLVVGEQSVLRNKTVAVVGLSGGGSHVVQQLAHAGVGTIVGVDHDASDSKKLHRMVGMRRRDGAIEMPKTSIMDRLVTEMASGTKFVPVPGRVPEPKAVAALVQADVIVACVDSLHARAAIHEIAWRHVIPMIDIGVSIRASAPGRIGGPRVVVAGNVLVLVPGGFCMWCVDFLSDAALAAERDGPDASYFRDRPGEAQVVSFNGLVASQAVTEVLQLLSGFAGDGIAPADLRVGDAEQRGYLKLNGVRGTLDEWGARRAPTCSRCAAHLAAGTIAWEPLDDAIGGAA